MMLLQSLLQDLRYGVRMLFRNASFTAVAVLALALGIGLNTAVFTAYESLFNGGVDARDPGRMVNFLLVHPSGAYDFLFSYPDYEAYGDHLHAFSGLTALRNNYDEMILTGAGGDESRRRAATDSMFSKWGLLPSNIPHSKAELASVLMVSENYFSVLGVAALRGRTFAAGDAAELAKSPAVLMSENYWQRRFGGDPSIVGKAIRLNGTAFTVIGITPHDFVGTDIAAPDFWYPLSLEALVHPGDGQLHDREIECCRLSGRLAPGVSMTQAQAETNVLADHLRSLHDSHSELSRPAQMELTPGSPFPSPPLRNTHLRFVVLLIMAAAGMVLVIACANVASLQLARAAARQNELGLRMSLGASRWRLIRQLLTESALLGLIAGAIAFLCSWALVKVLARMASEIMPADLGTFVVHVRPDLAIFAYVFAVSLVAGVLFGLAPALESSRSALSSALKANAATSPVRSRRVRGFLVGAQVAVSLVLLIAGSMLVRSSIQALKLDTGYADKQVAELTLQFPDTPEYNSERRAALVSAIRRRLAELPGVVSITSGHAPDDDGIRVAAISLDGQKPTARNTRALLYYTYVQPNYFAALGIPLLFGRGFQSQTGTPEPCAILSESAARQLWPGQNPMGKRLRMGTDGQYEAWGEIVPDGHDYEVIGVARDARGALMDDRDAVKVYVPLPEGRVQDYPILIRSRLDAAKTIGAIGPAILSIDPNMVATTATLEEMLRATEPFIASAMSAVVALTIGVFGLVLASMGIFGTVSYMVVLRTREVGIRMALGARRGQIAALIVRDSTRPVIAGLLVGLALATADSVLLRKVLYGLGAFDAISYAGVSLLLFAIALVAAYVPSRRAMRVDPMVALRYE
ncbi:MAG: ABC transporter permease [Terracidiphilus sp.]